MLPSILYHLMIVSILLAYYHMMEREEMNEDGGFREAKMAKKRASLTADDVGEGKLRRDGW